jgi:CubicO group peptidase (beta-lactamase class C family)
MISCGMRLRTAPWPLLAAALVALALRGAQPQGVSVLPPEKLRKAEALVAAEIMRHGIPGLSVAVVVGNQVRWSAGYGFADLENHVPAKAATVYRLGSICKPITAIAVMQLVEKGHIRLESPIQRYVPTFPPKRWPVTVRDLLCHVGGVRHYRPGEMTSTRHYDGVVPALALFKDDPLVFKPGTRFLYTTYGYCLLGAAVEHAAGMPYIDYVERYVLKPAGMARTRLDSVAEIIPDRAAGYVKAKNGEVRNSALADTSNKVPGGGLCGSVEDLARLAIALHEDILLPPEVVDRMFAAQRLSDGRPIGYGLGWSMFGEHRGRRAVGHAGAQPRISGLLYMVPQDAFAVAILCNLEGVNLLPLARALADDLDP